MQLSSSALDALRGEISKRLSGKRLYHTLSVENEIKHLGELYGFDEGGIIRLRAAALLHDITKEMKTEEHISFCLSRGIRITENDKKSPKLFHSLTGAYLARELYPDIVDKGIFNAILCHTSGKPRMTLFEKLLYLADYIEETRTFPDCVRLRELFYATDSFTEAHLDEILIASYGMTIKNLIDEGNFIHPRTVSSRNALVSSKRRRQNDQNN